MFSSRKISSYFWLAAAIALIGITATAAVLFFLVIGPGHSASIRHSQSETATQFAEIFNSRIEILKAQTDHIASMPRVRAAMAAKDKRALAGLEQRLSASIDKVLGVKLYLRGAALADLVSDPPVKFSALALTRAVESGILVNPEGHAHKGRLLIYHAAAVEDQSDNPIGSVLTIVDGQYFQAALDGAQVAPSTVVLRQKFQELSSVDILRAGPPPTDATPIVTSLAVPHWSALFYPGARVFRTLDTLSIERLAPTLGMALATVLGGIFLAYRALNRKVKRDLEKLPRIMVDRTGAERLELVGIQDAAHAMLKAVPPAQGARANVRPAPPPLSPPLAIPDAREIEIEIDEPLESDGFLELDISSAPSELEALGEATPEVPTPPLEVAPVLEEVPLTPTLDPLIFRAYDIRGVVGQNLHRQVVFDIGRAFGTEAAAANIDRVVVGGDGRLSTEELREALIAGLTDAGMYVYDIGMVPTPVLYYATHRLETGTGIQITGSHNPSDYNGLKMVMGYETLAEERITALYDRIVSGNLTTGTGGVEQLSVDANYLNEIADDIAIAQSLKVVLDAGNGVAGPLGVELLKALGCEVVELFCDVDGTFPNHHPDPSVAENMTDLIEAVAHHNADLGIAFDGDGDRLGVVSNTGEIIWPDRLMMLFARDIVMRNPGTDIVYDVKCSRHLNTLITEYGGRPVMWKTGHSHIKAKLKETGALLGGEYSGHICFQERWYGFDDALYSAARLLEILGAQTETIQDLMSEFPNPLGTTEIKIQTTEELKFRVIEQLSRQGNFMGGTINKIDGLRVDFPNGWGLIRASNTSPVLTLRFEAETKEALEQIAQIFQRELSKVQPDLTFSY